MVLEVVVIVLLSVLLLGALGYFLYEMFYEKELRPSDSTLLDNEFAPQYTRNFTRFVISDIIRGQDRIGFKLVPKDIPNLNYYSPRRKKYIIPQELKEPFIFWCEPEKFESYPKGTSSPHKNIIKIIPLSVYDVPLSLRNSVYGKSMMETIEKTNSEMNSRKFIERELSKTKELVNSDLFGELSIDAMEKVRDLSSDSLRVAFREKDRQQYSGYSGNPTGGK